MPLDINVLRKDRGGDPDFWRENQRRRFCDPGLVDTVLALDEVCGCACSLRVFASVTRPSTLLPLDWCVLPAMASIDHRIARCTQGLWPHKQEGTWLLLFGMIGFAIGPFSRAAMGSSSPCFSIWLQSS